MSQLGRSVGASFEHGEPVRVFDSGVVFPEPGSFGEYRLTYRTGDMIAPQIEAAEPLGLELKDFASAIRSRFSASEPSHQCTASGWVSRATSSTHRFNVWSLLDMGGGRFGQRRLRRDASDVSGGR